jgi:hypothetical protein
VRGHLEPAEQAAVVGASPPHVGRQDQHLRAEPGRDLVDQLGAGDRRGVDPDLVGTGAQQPVDVLHRTHAATHGERDEDLLGGAADDVVGRLAVAAAGGDVEEGQLVRALAVIRLGELHRVTRVPQVLEAHTLDHTAGVDVETGDDTGGDAHPARVSV